MSQFFDIVIVGAGSAGCALANRLSTDPALRVGLLEAGGDDSREAIRVPHQYFSLWGTDVDWQYVSTAQPGTRGRTHVMPRGRVMGGTSSLNGMVYLRGAASDYDAWASAGCTGWGWSDVVPSFEAMEAWLRPAVLEPHNPVSVAMRDAAVEFGLPLNPDFDSGTLDGSGWNKATILDGERHNANRAFLEPIAERENLRIIPETRVSRVMFEGNRVTGLEVIQNGRIDTIAAGEVILAAGAFESPRILMLSGIGPADHLIDHGIVPRHDCRLAITSSITC